MAFGSNVCLRIYSVSFRNSAQANLYVEVVFTESAFFIESDDSEVHVCRFYISSGGLRLHRLEQIVLSQYSSVLVSKSLGKQE